ncbi:MAG: tetratricopeptide repeat protein, partial [Pseudomonadota bacterium]
ANGDDIENASLLLEQLREELPQDGDVLEAYALVKLRQGDEEEARRLFFELLETGDNTADAMFYLARFAEGDRRPEQAVRLYSQVTNGDFVIAAQQRASQIIRSREGIPAAIEHLDSFISRHARYGLALSTVRASLYARGGYFDQSLELYDDYLTVKPASEFALLARADVLLQSDNLDSAIDAFRAAVKRYPDSPGALNALGYTLADRTNKLREAERLIDKALDKEPDNAAIIDSKGWVLFRRGKFAEARDYLQRAYDEFQDAEVAAHLGEVMWRMGDEDEARELLQEAWQRQPNDKVLRDTIRRLMEGGPTTRS